MVETDKGLWKRHIDQIREREIVTTGSTPELPNDSDDLDLIIDTGARRDPPPPPTPPTPESPPEAIPETEVANPLAPPPVAPPDPGLTPIARYPVRARQPPDYFGH